MDNNGYMEPCRNVKYVKKKFDLKQTEGVVITLFRVRTVVWT